jgi:4'-phosphopantetheinyl transferase
MRVADADRWVHPPEQSELAGGDVHIWHVEAPPRAAEQDWLLLCPTERARAQRFAFDRDRQRFAAFRAALRGILSLYLHQSPRSIRFQFTPAGKPSLIPQPGCPDIRFNLSHSRQHALIALTVGREIGVDLEHQPDDESIAAAVRFFSDSENAFIRSRPPHEQADAFLICWTRKEAWLKALGGGLRDDMNRFDVSDSLGPAGGKLVDHGANPAAWSVRELRPTRDSVGAIVVEGDLQNLNLYDSRHAAPAALTSADFQS